MDADVLIVGGGVAGLSAGIFTGRAGLDTLIVNDGEPILARNAHLENFPGFPQGVDARRFLAMAREQARDAGCEFLTGRVTAVEAREGEEGEGSDAGEENTPGFAVTVDDGTVLDATRVVAATKSNADYLDGVDVDVEVRGSKRYVSVDHAGRTGVPGLYAAGRLANQYHQAVVCAGHGATVGITAIQESDVDFYHDWVTPEGYFTGRGRDVPPGCEEIDDEERLAREARGREAVDAHLDGEPAERPTMHPSVAEDE